MSALWPTLLLLPGLAPACGVCAPPADDPEAPIAAVEPLGLGAAGDRIWIEVRNPRGVPLTGRLLAACAGRPLGWFEPDPTGAQPGRFVSRSPCQLPARADPPRAWLIAPGLTGTLRAQWPPGAALRAKIDALGPASGSAWIDAGASAGVRPGDCWWRRANGQPVARFDVRLVDAELCYCRVVPLVAGLELHAGDDVALWPSPAEQHAGAASTAVSFIEATGDGQLAWVAAPPPVATPPEPRVEFYRDGVYVGSGVMERSDTRFWYVRTLPAAGRDQVRVGDDAVVRTLADVRARRFAARVFETTPEGVLINAGENDGLRVGDVGVVYRAGCEVARIRLRRVQSGYSVAERLRSAEESPVAAVGPASAPGAEAGNLQHLDEVLFAPRPEPPAPLALVERVVDQTAFSALLLNDGRPPLGTPMAIRRRDRVIGAAVLVAAADRRGIGFALERSLSEALAVGDELVASTDPAP